MAHVPHIYLPRPWPETVLPLPERSRHHLVKVLRRRQGDPISYTDGAGTVGLGRLAEDGVERGDEAEIPAPRPAVTLAVAAPARAERARFLVEKAAELGVDRLVWLATTHGDSKPPSMAKAKAWAAAALEQSRGAQAMAIDGPVGPDALPGTLWVADPGGSSPPAAANSPVTLLVGPEGGFAAGEAPSRAFPMSLGDRVLRVETAAVVGAILVLQAVGRYPSPR